MGRATYRNLGRVLARPATKSVLTGALLAVAALVTAGCASTTDARDIRIIPIPAATVVDSSIPLERVILTELSTQRGGPWARQPYAVGDTGPSDLAKAIADDTSADTQQVLTTNGFIDGFQQLFTNGSNEVIVFVYRFKSAAGAAAFLTRDSALLPATSERFNVTGINSAIGARLESSNGRLAEVLFSSSGYYVETRAAIADGALTFDDTARLASDVARQQLAALPGEPNGPVGPGPTTTNATAA
jgi:hypothetical protein